MNYRSTGTLAIALLVFSALAASLAFAQAPGNMGQMHRSMWMVPGVSDASLTAEQRQQIAQIRQYRHQQMMNVRQDPDLTAAQRQERLQEIQRQTHEQIMNVLTTEQRERFLERHRRGSRGAQMGRGPAQPAGQSGWNVPGVPASELSATQREQIRIARARAQELIRDVRMNPDLTPEQREQRIAEIQQETHSQVLSYLTPEQRQDFEAWWKNR